MAAQVSLDAKLLQQLQQTGELRVEDTHGVPLVLMTIDARDQLHKVVYDDRDITDKEMMAMGTDQLNDPEGWGAPNMDVYDTMKGIDPNTHGSS